MNKRRLRIIKYMAIAVAVMVLAWGASAIAVYAVSSGRVFDSASMDAVPRQRAAVVMGCVRTLPNGLNNLYFSRRIDAAVELYKADKSQYHRHIFFTEIILINFSFLRNVSAPMQPQS